MFVCCSRAVSMCGLLLFAGFTSADEATAIRVMSFNVRYGTANDGNDAWPLRRELVVRTIMDFGPDLLGTQEMLPFQADYLSSQLPEYDYTGWSRDESANGEQCGLFVRKSRFDITESGQFWLSETPDIKFSKSWDSSLPRVVTWVRLRDKSAAGQSILFANTHFDHRGADARRQSAILTRERLSKLGNGGPVLLTGDFNCGTTSEPAEELLSGALLTDTFRSIHSQPASEEGTFHGFKGQAGKERIDWILTSSHFRTTEAGIVRTNDSGRYPSDHFPVTAVVKPEP